MPDAVELWTSVENFVKVLGPFAGVYFAARVIISYQKDLLGSLQVANSDLRGQLKDQDGRIDHLETLILKLRREQIICERRNGILIDAVQRAGIEVPPLPHLDLMDDFED